MVQFARASLQNPKTRTSGLALVIAAAVTVLLSLLNISDGIESDLRDGRDALRMVPASGTIAIVEIDGRSLQQLDQWPWPRRHYAKAITELDRLGAEKIAFDIDFSSTSTPEDDALLAKAFTSISQPAILPTFRQLSQTPSGYVASEALPLPAFQENAFLASVNVFPEPDGKITFYPHGVTTRGTPRPSLPNMLAQTGGAVGESFRIDQAIDVETIPRISFIDLLEGTVPRRDIEGKRFVFGATAIELGDRYPTALFGVQHGVVIQAQAAETLLQNRMRGDVPAWLALIIVIPAFGLAVLMWSRSRGSRIGPTALSAMTGATITVTALILDQASLPYIPLAGAILFLGLFTAFYRAFKVSGILKAERMTDMASGIANAKAMAKALSRRPGSQVAVARIADFIDVMTVLGSSRMAMLDAEIVKRLELLAGIERIYRLDSGLFGWLVRSEGEADPESIFASARALFTSPITIDNERFRINTNFGFAASSIEDAIFASADARKRGLVWSSNTESIHQNAQFRQRVLGQLDHAIDNGEISVVYQPKLRMKDDAIASAECLVRWNSEQFGIISPSEFIPLLEERERIDELTDFVLEQAAIALKMSKTSGFAPNIAVNLSAQLLNDDAFLDRAVRLIERINSAENGGLTLEITESAPLVDSVKARMAIERLSAAGARISIDDYGTGQATLNYLQDFPAQELKLDKSFISNMIGSPKDRIMVESTLAMAHALGFDVVAEGVEDGATLQMLREMGCDYAQGWHIGRPMAWDDFAALARRPLDLTEAA